MDATHDAVRSLNDRLTIAGGLLGAFVVLYTLGKIVYNYWFHPLARFPGPFLNAVSDVHNPTNPREYATKLTRE